MQLIELSREAASTELLRRRRARESLVAFSQAITIPGAPLGDDPDGWLFKPIETSLAAHHLLLMEAVERCVLRAGGRLMVFLPPGSAKSTYASVVTPPWAMGRSPGFKVILASYAATPAERQSKRCRSIVASAEYAGIWPERVMLKSGSAAVNEWDLTNDSTFLAAGILGAVTSARADLLIIDDPVAGREEANSETVRKKTREAYDDDLLTRLKPNGSVILIQTRWHPEDLAGSILPEDYAGESGMVACRDGQTWEVLCIPAKAERLDDPLGRTLGTYLWPEWFPESHWAQFERNPRTWPALYQQRPRPDSGNQFEAAWFQWYDPEDLPEQLRIYGASDYAVTEASMDADPDYTEHGVIGVDPEGRIFVRDWWSGQNEPDVTVQAELDLTRRWKPAKWYGEAGVIEKAIKPLRKRMAREKEIYCEHEYLPSLVDKVSRAAGIRARTHAGTVFLPRGKAWAERLVDQMCAFPFGRYKDGVDVMSLFGRALDDMRDAKKPSVQSRRNPTPFNRHGIEASDRAQTRADDERRRYSR